MRWTIGGGVVGNPGCKEKELEMTTLGKRWGGERSSWRDREKAVGLVWACVKVVRK